jgi:hypothetical protein
MLSTAKKKKERNYPETISTSRTNIVYEKPGRKIFFVQGGQIFTGTSK